MDLYYKKICEAAEEGAVLLKNKDNTLPFNKDDNIAIFSRCQIDYYKSGTGSGGSVHVPYSTNLIDGFDNLKKKSSDVPQINQELLSLYKEWLKENPFDNGGGGWAAEPWCQKDMDLTDEIVSKAKSQSNKAVYIIGRTAGEDKDNAAEKGSYLLTDQEESNLEVICKAFDKVTVILNVSNIIDLSFTESPKFNNHITAILFTWHGGQEAGNATANVLCGKTNPSGKLSDTIAKSIEDYPCTKNFGAKDVNRYEEDIYVGYRYFVTFAKDKILYPFGYGLSYTTFDYKAIEYSFDGKSIKVKVTVKNTGKIPGKEVIQLYYQAPQGLLGKSARELCVYKKTPLLNSNESCTLDFDICIDKMASYDDSGITGYPYSYVLEKGAYSIYVGTDCLSATEVLLEDNSRAELKETVLVKKLQQCAAPNEPLNRLKPGAIKADGTFEITFEEAPLNKVNLEQRIKDNLPKEIEYTGDKGITFDDVIADHSKMDAFIAQLTTKELCTIVRGEGMMSRKVTLGIAAAFGGLSQSLHDKKVRVGGCSDGPSGIRLDTGKEACLVPIGTLLACSFNTELVKELYSFVGQEMINNNIDLLLGPGINIHRGPLNGRNFEYYSEDPLLTGTMAVATIKGLAQSGAGATVKHFACNNQELNRRGENNIVSERALREIYLKAFEMSVKEGNTPALMTSYNPTNGYWAASNYDLVNTVLHQEWGFKGLTMTDWWTTINHCIKGGESSVKNTDSMVKARNDVYMVVDNDGAESNHCGDNLEESLKSSFVTLGELQLCVKDVLTSLLTLPVSRRPINESLNKETRFESKISVLPEGAKLVDFKEMFIPDDNTYIKIDEKCLYIIMGAFVKDGKDTLSQSVSNILIDGESAASLECRSTDGKVTTVNAAQVEFDVGYYKVSLEHTKPGIDVKGICLTNQNFNPILMGILN